MSGTTVTFASIASNNYVTAGGNKNYIVVFDLASTAAAADTLSAQVTKANITAQGAASSVTIPLGGSDVTGPTHKVSGSLTLAAPSTQVTNSLLGDAGGAAIDNALLGFKLTAVNETASITQIRVSLNYTGLADGDLNVFKLYEDAGTVGTYDSDIFVTAGSAPASGVVTFDLGSPISLTTAASPKHYIVTYRLVTAGVAGETVAATISAAGITATGSASSLSLIPTGPDVISPAHTVTGGWHCPTRRHKPAILPFRPGRCRGADLELVSFKLAAAGNRRTFRR